MNMEHMLVADALVQSGFTTKCAGIMTRQHGDLSLFHFLQGETWGFGHRLHGHTFIAMTNEVSCTPDTAPALAKAEEVLFALGAVQEGLGEITSDGALRLYGKIEEE